MRFKEFLENIRGNLDVYRRLFGLSTVTVTITVYGVEYNVHRLVRCGESEVSFAYYSDTKSTKASGEVVGGIAWPTLTVPYEEIQAIEFNPAPPEANRIGFVTD